MIQLRKNPFSETSIDVAFKDGERASELIDRVLQENGYEVNDNLKSGFHIVINGLSVESDMWEFVEIKESDTVLLTPKIARGSGGQLFKQIAIIVITVAAAYFLGPAGAGLQGAALAAATAAVSVATTLAMNALIPPPEPPGLGGFGNGSSLDSSQMYSITSQSNAAKKFGHVPKVYGTHRMFPIIAANPYTEIEADDKGNLVQFYYAIYDFGFGPLDIAEIKIGDTPIVDYSDADFRLVDPNKPAVDEGPWDEELYTNFEFYKGDVERDGTAVALDKNQTTSGAQLHEYQVVRFASTNVDGCDQEISLDFVCPQGLIAYATNGNTYTRNIDLHIEFSKADEENWKPYNDSDYVYDFSTAGGASVYSNRSCSVLPMDRDGTYYTRLSANTYGYYNENSTTRHYGVHYKYGYRKGTTYIPLKTGNAVVGERLYISGKYIGKIGSITAHSVSGYSRYHLTAPTKVNHVIYEWKSAHGLIGSSALTSRIYAKYLSMGAARISARNTNQVYATFKFKPKEIAAYKVRITRKTSHSSASYRTFDKLTLASLSTRFDRAPIVTDKRHVFVEVRIRATNQLNGNIQNLSATVSSVLDVYDPDTSTWSKQVTSNPAWVFCDLLTGILNKRAISKDRLHLPSILEWAEFCDEIPNSPTGVTFETSRFSCNFVLDFETTLQSLLNSVAQTCQASLNIVDGKYGVLLDKLKTVPVQIFTPRNSWGFSSTRSYVDSPHGLKITYIDPEKDWQVSEIVAYDNGYNEDNATEFDELSAFACTNWEQAWRYGRYMIAQSRLRKENITINVDFEHIVCTRGDYVQITQDVMQVGGRPARVKSVVGNRVKIDDAIDTLGGISYGYVYRSVSDGVKTNTLTVVDSDEFDLDGDIPAVGDLIIIGEVGKIVFDCLVKAIVPSSDLSATITLAEKADAVYEAEYTDVFPEYNPNLSQNVDSELATPPAVEDLEVIENSWRVNGSAYEYFVDIDWELPTGAAFETFEIYVDNGTGYDLIDFTKESTYEYIVDHGDLGVEHWFKVLAVSSTGKKIPLIEAPAVSATPVRKVTPPSDVEGLFINITNQVIQLDWPAVLDTDLNEYIIRYSPNTETATWEASIPLMRADKNTTLSSTQGRTGTYFIKARDLNGNESVTAAQARTAIPKLFDLNVIEETNDFPDLLGELVTAEKDEIGLVLKRIVSGGTETNEYFSEGYYYYENFLDLGEIYTVRLQSLIEAEGFTVGDLMENWESLELLTAMSQAGQSDWDVETHYRTTDAFNVMSEWSSMSDVDPISEGDQDQWTSWTKFIMGDATGRIFQFRLKLISNVASVTPRVIEGKIRADMPDRIETYNDQVAPPEGLDIVYDPSFAGPGTSPNIQITQDNAQSGDYYLLTNKTLAGFKITFYDKNDVAVTRQFDAAIKGYGRKASSVI